MRLNLKHMWLVWIYEPWKSGEQIFERVKWSKGQVYLSRQDYNLQVYKDTLFFNASCFVVYEPQKR